jgi:nucleoside 2-deoxyribosyltransferase
VAGPLGFTPYGLDEQRRVCAALRRAGFEPLDPWESEAAALFAATRRSPPGEERRTALAEANRFAGRLNEELIARSLLVLASLDGPDVDSGTASEIGFAAALGRPVVGLRTDSRQAGDNEATVVNLQVEWFIVRNGGSIQRSLTDAIEALRRLAAERT